MFDLLTVLLKIVLKNMYNLDDNSRLLIFALGLIWGAYPIAYLIKSLKNKSLRLLSTILLIGPAMYLGLQFKEIDLHAREYFNNDNLLSLFILLAFLSILFSLITLNSIYGFQIGYNVGYNSGGILGSIYSTIWLMTLLIQTYAYNLTSKGVISWIHTFPINLTLSLPVTLTLIVLSVKLKAIIGRAKWTTSLEESRTLDFYMGLFYPLSVVLILPEFLPELTIFYVLIESLGWLTGRKSIKVTRGVVKTTYNLTLIISFTVILLFEASAASYQLIKFMEVV